MVVVLEMKMGKVIYMDRQIEFARLIRVLAETYNRQVSPDLIKIYYGTLSDLSQEHLQLAVTLYMNAPENRFFPTPGQLRAMIMPSDEDQATEAVARILYAIKRYGGDYKEHHEKAKEHIGELGWKIVEKMGGWSRFLTFRDENEIGPLAQSQWRKYAMGVLSRHRLGILEEAPALEFKPKKLNQLENIGELIKMIPDKLQKKAE